MEKYFWQNKWVFILAAVWSAAGLWNLWRFPYQVYKYGWGSFIVAYLIILFLLGIGLLIWEIAFGQYTQKWAPEAFWQVSKYLKWVWWAAIFTGAVILTYYAVVIWWWIDYLWYSIKALFWWTLPWADNAKDFFFNNVLHLTKWISNSGSVSIPVLLWTFAAWILIYLFTFKSTKSVGKVVLVTATLPFITLLVLAIRGITLPGAMEWLKYLFSFNKDLFFSLELWKAAAWQIFFTLSLAMGIMIAYWSLKKPDSEIVNSTVLVAIWNTLVSFLSAIAVFSTLWYLAVKSGVWVDKVVDAWPGLVFVVLPKTIALLPAFQALFAVIFFITVFALAIDSAMSSIEAVSRAIRDKFENVPVEIITLIVSVILGLGSLLYVFGNGLYILDIVDHFITSWSMLFIWVIEALVFLFIGKKLISFILERNSCKLKFLFNKYYFWLSFALNVVVLGYLLILNLKKWIAYGWYPDEYLLMYGVYVIVGIYALAILINIVDILTSKKK